ncbi:MAG: C-GCAxxG-C-C family protein [Rikenellaceae bacterium]
MRVNVEERAAQARAYFTQGYNCSQSVVLTFSDIMEIDPEILATLSASFGGGMGRLREVCGAVSGMAFVASKLAPCPSPTDRAAKSANYSLVQELAEEFRRENRYIVCRELLGLTQPKDEPTPSERTPEYYKKRPCAELVAQAATIVATKINELE